MSDVAIQLFEAIPDISLDPIAKLIGILTGAVGVGVGIIIFTLILKTIVLPFDIYQRVSTRKQSLKMEEMRPELEKLQKQYANDKAMYSQKMMELYKKNNYSMFGACLPMILMMVILIVAFNELNYFSQYSNLHAYSNMVEVYNEEILEFSEEDELLCETEEVILNGVSYVKYQGKEEKDLIYYLKSESGKKDYYIDVEKAYAYAKEEVDGYIAAEEASTAEEGVQLFVQNKGREAAAKSFRSTKISFLWIKNIWYSDTAWTHSLGTYSDFTGKITKKIEVTNEDGSVSKVNVNSVISESTYNEITANLDEEKSDVNGYFVLCVLSIGLMFLSQFISMKSQKAQNDLGTVNGQGKSTQKMMMIIMPIIFGIFAFTYSGAFSIYMVVSSAYSILTMLLSQFFVDKAFRKKERRELQAKYQRTDFTKMKKK